MSSGGPEKIQFEAAFDFAAAGDQLEQWSQKIQAEQEKILQGARKSARELQREVASAGTSFGRGGGGSFSGGGGGGGGRSWFTGGGAGPMPGGRGTDPVTRAANEANRHLDAEFKKAEEAAKKLQTDLDKMQASSSRRRAAEYVRFHLAGVKTALKLEGNEIIMAERMFAGMKRHRAGKQAMYEELFSVDETDLKNRAADWDSRNAARGGGGGGGRVGAEGRGGIMADLARAAIPDHYVRSYFRAQDAFGAVSAGGGLKTMLGGQMGRIGGMFNGGNARAAALATAQSNAMLGASGMGVTAAGGGAAGGGAGGGMLAASGPVAAIAAIAVAITAAGDGLIEGYRSGGKELGLLSESASNAGAALQSIWAGAKSFFSGQWANGLAPYMFETGDKGTDQRTKVLDNKEEMRLRNDMARTIDIEAGFGAANSKRQGLEGDAAINAVRRDTGTASGILGGLGRGDMAEISTLDQIIDLRNEEIGLLREKKREASDAAKQVIQGADQEIQKQKELMAEKKRLIKTDQDNLSEARAKFGSSSEEDRARLLDIARRATEAKQLQGTERGKAIEASLSGEDLQRLMGAGTEGAKKLGSEIAGRRAESEGFDQFDIFGGEERRRIQTNQQATVSAEVAINRQIEIKLSANQEAERISDAVAARTMELILAREAEIDRKTNVKIEKMKSELSQQNQQQILANRSSIRGGSK